MRAMLPMMVTRGEFYRNRLADILGIEAAGDYAKPDMLVTGTQTLDLGGRTLTLQTYPTAHTDNDMTILDEATATLWTGDLLFVGRIPALDGSIIGWLSMQSRHCVPWQRNGRSRDMGPSSRPGPRLWRRRSAICR